MTSIRKSIASSNGGSSKALTPSKLSERSGAVVRTDASALGVFGAWSVGLGGRRRLALSLAACPHELAELEDVVVNAVFDPRPRPAVLAKPSNSPHDLLVVFLRVRLHLAHGARADRLGDGEPRASRKLSDGCEEPVVFILRPNSAPRVVTRTLPVNGCWHGQTAITLEIQVRAQARESQNET
ncbi:hypothetical protein ON010_g2331 [Phytophthora cinnamomi]|nr:hypothetical protein ON010_g2331 [Phytophthora cinnamomi]